MAEAIAGYLDESASGLNRYLEALSGEVDKFARKLDRVEKDMGALRETLLEKNEQIEILKGDYKKGVEKDIAKHVADFANDFETYVRNDQEKSGEDVVNHVQGMLGELLESLSIVRFPKDGEEWKGKKVKRAECVGKVNTTDPALNECVAEVVYGGFEHKNVGSEEEGEVLKVAKVKVYKYDAQQADSTGEEPQTQTQTQSA